MPRRPKAPPAPILPPSHLDALQAAGFDVLRWRHVAIEVQPYPDGTTRREWLPMHCVNWEARRFIEYRTDGEYAFAGWEPQDGLHTRGGRYPDVHGALGWFRWLDDQRKRSA